MSCTVSGEVVILHLEDGAYYGLNAVGTRVWELLQQPRTLGQLVSEVVGEFDVGPEQCERDLRELLQAMMQRGLVGVGAP